MIEKLTTKRSKKINQSDLQLPPLWSKYLRSVDNGNNELQDGYFLSGRKRELANYLIQLIKGAKESVVISSFLLADSHLEDAIFEAAIGGVRVYIMLACETRLEGEVPDDDFGKNCLEQHVNMLKRLAGKVVFRSAPHFHSKIVMVDALNTSNFRRAKGVLCTGNLTTQAFERNEELAVVLNTDEIAELVELLKWAMFEYAEHEMIEEDYFSAVQPLGGVSFPLKLSKVLCTSPYQKNIREQVLEIVKDSKQELIVASFGWQEDHEIIDAICQKARAGVRVKILARVRPASIPALIKLAKSGADVLGYKWLHAKAIWNESNKGVLMSANLQKHGLDEGFEVGLLVEGDRALRLKKCLDAILRNGSSDVQRLHIDSTLGAYTGDLTYWENNKLNRVSIQPSIIEDLGNIEASCVTKVDIEPQIPRQSWQERPARIIEYRWSVLPPTLPVNSKEIYLEGEVSSVAGDHAVEKKNDKKNKSKVAKRSYAPQVFKKGSRTMIVIDDETELHNAEQLRSRSFKSADIVFRV